MAMVITTVVLTAWPTYLAFQNVFIDGPTGRPTLIGWVFFGSVAIALLLSLIALVISHRESAAQSKEMAEIKAAIEKRGQRYDPQAKELVNIHQSGGRNVAGVMSVASANHIHDNYIEIADGESHKKDELSPMELNEILSRIRKKERENSLSNKLIKVSFVRDTSGYEAFPSVYRALRDKGYRVVCDGEVNAQRQDGVTISYIPPTPPFMNPMIGVCIGDYTISP